MKADSLLGYNKKDYGKLEWIHWRATKMVRGAWKQDLSILEEKSLQGQTPSTYKDTIKKTEPGYSWWYTVEGWETTAINGWFQLDKGGIKKKFHHEDNETSEPREVWEGLFSETLDPLTMLSEFNADSALSRTLD